MKPEPVTAAGGVVFRKNEEPLPDHVEVLVIYRRGVWDLPKGKQEKGESIERCAVREVAEEIGINALPDILASLGTTYHEYKQDGRDYGKTTHWFAMKLPVRGKVQFEPQTAEGILKVEWCTLKEGKKRVGYDNLVEVLETLERWIEKSSV